MPHVASSSAKLHPHSHAQGRTARPAQDRGTPSLFDSLVADTDAAATQQNSPTDRSQRGADPAQGSATKSAATSEPDNAPASAPQADQNIVPDKSATAADQALAGAATDAAKAAAEATQADTSKPAADKDQSATHSGDDQAAATATPAAVDPTLAAAVVVPTQAAQVIDQTAVASSGSDAVVTATAVGAAAAKAASEQDGGQPASGQSGGQAAGAQAAITGAAVETTAQAGPETPAQPAFVAASTAQKLAPFDSKGKAAAAKSAADAKPALPATASAAAADQEATPQPQADPAAAAPQTATNAVVAGKPEAKPGAPAHHDRIDATVTVAAPLDGVASAGTDSGMQAAAAGATVTGGGAAHAGAAASASVAAQPGAAMPQAAAVPLAGIAVEIASRAQAGKNNFEIRLDPPELGRIQVKLSVDRQGQITSHVIADRADTLDLLRRDASGLERSLQDAGLKTTGNGLQFSLRDQSFNGQQNSASQPNASPVLAQDETLAIGDVAASSYTRYSGRIGGVDIRV